MESFEKFNEEMKDKYGVDVVTLKLQCEKCNTVWGLRINDYNKFSDIPEKKFICFNCKE